jgi:hypothetical protein
VFADLIIGKHARLGLGELCGLHSRDLRRGGDLSHGRNLTSAGSPRMNG